MLTGHQLPRLLWSDYFGTKLSRLAMISIGAIRRVSVLFGLSRYFSRAQMRARRIERFGRDHISRYSRTVQLK